MNRYSGTIICLAYSIGLLFTRILAFSDTFPPWWEWLARIAALSLLTLLGMFVIPRLWWLSPPRKVWLIAGFVAILASFYVEFRTPYPTDTDISQIVSKRARTVIVTGNSISQSRLNRKGNLQFWLQVQAYSVNDLSPEKATGKLYVTLPDRAENQVYSGQKVSVKGLLYRPRQANNPSAFDFREYLARQGAFAGLKGTKIIDKLPPPWGVWKIRERIVTAQIQGLGAKKGALVSSIALGRNAVDLPVTIQDLFIKTGLAHVLAASGFQVALFLGVVLGITQKLSSRKQFIIGVTVLLFYLTLTGLQPSIARAVLMGIAGLIGILYNRKTDALGSLMVAATILLLWQPLWIWDLGFQLSFLSTFGLIVTVPFIQNKLDYFPSILAEPIGITLAATLWTLPLLLHTFSSIALYSIFINVITNPLIIVLSLGGTISALSGFVYPPLGSITAGLLYYPIELLLQILSFFTRLPMSTYATGKLSLGAMIIIYILLGLLWMNPWLQRKWYLVAFFIIALILIPIVYHSFTLTEVTVFATKKEPAIVIQDRGQTVLINGNDPDTARYTILPFLREQGINRIQGVISVLSAADWSVIRQNLPIDREINLGKQNSVTIGSIAFQSRDNFIQFQILGNTWLWITDPEKKVTVSPPITPLALIWTGKTIEERWLQIIQPRAAIAITSRLSNTTRKQLKNAAIEYFQTGRDGAIQWTPREGFKAFIEENGPFP